MSAIAADTAVVLSPKRNAAAAVIDEPTFGTAAIVRQTSNAVPKAKPSKPAKNTG